MAIPHTILIHHSNMTPNNENSPNESNRLRFSPLIDRDELLMPLPSTSDDDRRDNDRSPLPVLLLPRLDHSEIPVPEDSLMHSPISESGSATQSHTRSPFRPLKGRPPLRDITVDCRWH